MPWWLDLVLLAAAIALWFRSVRETDDVWALFIRGLSVVAILVVMLGGHALLLELLVLGVACWLPSATACERRSQRP